MFRSVRFAAPPYGPAQGGKAGSPWEGAAGSARKLEARGKPWRHRRPKHGTPWDGRAAGLAGGKWKPVGTPLVTRALARRGAGGKILRFSAVCGGGCVVMALRSPHQVAVAVVPRASMVRSGNPAASHRLPPFPPRAAQGPASHGLPCLTGHSHPLPQRRHTGFHSWRSRRGTGFPRGSTPTDSPFPPASAFRHGHPTVFHPPSSTNAVNQGIAGSRFCLRENDDHKDP